MSLTPNEPAARIREVKLVLLGEAGVGKSSLVLRFVSNHFKEFSESTIGYVCSSFVILLSFLH